MIRLARWCVNFSLLFLFAGCASERVPYFDSHYIDIKGPDPVIKPLSSLSREASVTILPFQTPGHMDKEHGGRIALLFKDVFLQKGVFRTVSFSDSPFGDMDDALRLGRGEGADLVIAGKVNYALYGTDLGGTRMDLSIRLLHVHTGNTVWYLNEAMDEPINYPDNRFLTRLFGGGSPPSIRRSQASPASSVMLARIASDVADKIRGGGR